MSTQSFENVKDLQFMITLGVGTFGSSDANQVTLQGLRATVLVNNGGGNMYAELTAQIYGVSQQDMAQITTIAYYNQSVLKNTIYVFAVDGDQTTQIFEGNIFNAWGNYSNQPDVFLEIQARAGLINSLQPIPASSYKGNVDAGAVMGSLASTMGYGFESNLSAPAPLSNPSLPGTAMDQAASIAKAAGIWWGIDNGTLWITAPNQPRMQSSSVPVISPQTGLSGYPTFDGYGVNFRCLFNAGIKFMGQVSVVSSIPKATATWLVTGVNHHLQSNTPGGAWFTDVRANFSGLAS
jgi:hypothetical protein